MPDVSTLAFDATLTVNRVCKRIGNHERLGPPRPASPLFARSCSARPRRQACRRTVFQCRSRRPWSPSLNSYYVSRRTRRSVAACGAAKSTMTNTCRLLHFCRPRRASPLPEPPRTKSTLGMRSSVCQRRVPLSMPHRPTSCPATHAARTAHLPGGRSSRRRCLGDRPVWKPTIEPGQHRFDGVGRLSDFTQLSTCARGAASGSEGLG